VFDSRSHRRRLNDIIFLLRDAPLKLPYSSLFLCLFVLDLKGVLLFILVLPLRWSRRLCDGWLGLASRDS
jgi:hypothetical protein